MTDQNHAPDPATNAIATTLMSDIWRAAGGDDALLENVTMVGSGDLASAFAVSDLAVASIGAAALAIAEFIGSAGGHTPAVRVDRRLASLWFANSLKPVGWTLPPAWDAIAGDYRASDGWIRLHTNAPHHRAAALAVLDVTSERAAVAEAVSRWQADELEAAVVESGGCAAVMRSLSAWAEHPQGRSVGSEPLVWHEQTDGAETTSRPIDRRRPLAGIWILDLTRVLAGPVATRFLAGFGAEVLRIDPPEWDEPGVVPEVTLGKRCARLNLHQPEDRERFTRLLADADVLVHGY